MVKSEWNIPKIEDLLRMIFRDRLELAAEYVVTKAKQNITDNRSVDTGRLRDSINYQVEFDGNKMTASIGTNVEYAPYIEFGSGERAEAGDGRKGGWYYRDSKGIVRFTRGNKARPFLRPALLENIPNIKKILGAK